MNHAELGAELQKALGESGRTLWELSRRANVRVKLVEDLLAGAGSVPISALVRVAEALQFEVALVAAKPAFRHVGPVKSVVDLAVERLHQAGPNEPDSSARRYRTL